MHSLSLFTYFPSFSLLSLSMVDTRRVWLKANINQLALFCLCIKLLFTALAFEACGFVQSCCCIFQYILYVLLPISLSPSWHTFAINHSKDNRLPAAAYLQMSIHIISSPRHQPHPQSRPGVVIFTFAFIHIHWSGQSLPVVCLPMSRPASASPSIFSLSVCRHSKGRQTKQLKGEIIVSSAFHCHANIEVVHQWSAVFLLSHLVFHIIYIYILYYIQMHRYSDKEQTEK